MDQQGRGGDVDRSRGIREYSLKVKSAGLTDGLEVEVKLKQNQAQMRKTGGRPVGAGGWVKIRSIYSLRCLLSIQVDVGKI